MSHRDVRRVVKANTMITQVKIILANIRVSLRFIEEDYDGILWLFCGDQPRRKSAEGDAHVK